MNILAKSIIRLAIDTMHAPSVIKFFEGLAKKSQVYVKLVYVWSLLAPLEDICLILYYVSKN